jgi:PAS domain S-box-containing protein
MGTTQLESLRCNSCGKLLLKGSLGLGIIEIKCGRCGSMNVFHSLDDLITEWPEAYILVFDSDGLIVTASRSAEQILGYTAEEFSGLNMVKLNPKFIHPKTGILTNYDIGENEQPISLLGKRMYKVTHIKKDGTPMAATARYYPFGPLNGKHTMIILSPRGSIRAIDTADHKLYSRN